MKTVLAMATLASAAAMTAATPASALTRIDFEGGSNGSSVGSTYSALGVTFGNATFGSYGSVPGSSGVRQIISTNGSTIPTAAQAITGTFSTAVSLVGIRGLDVGAAGIRLEAFGAGGTLLGFDEFFGTGLGVDTFRDLSVSATGITSFRFFQPAQNGTDGIIFDDFVFEATAAVPEPATWAMMMLGFGAMGFALRRRRDQQVRVTFA